MVSYCLIVKQVNFYIILKRECRRENLQEVSFLLGLLWLLVLLLADPGADGLDVVGDQALSQKIPQGLSRKRTAT